MCPIIRAGSEILVFQAPIRFPASTPYGMVLWSYCNGKHDELAVAMAPQSQHMCLSVNPGINRVSANKRVANFCYNIVQIMI
jgi:hypothetical protein